MSQNTPAGIDLSGLPPEIRRKVEAGLARLSPEMRQHWEQQGSPLLAKLVANAGGKVAKATPPPVPARPSAASAPRPGGMELPAHPPHHLNPRSAPRGHYNDTIRPGDGQSLRWLPLIIVVAVAAAIWFQF